MKSPNLKSPNADAKEFWRLVFWLFLALVVLGGSIAFAWWPQISSAYEGYSVLSRPMTTSRAFKREVKRLRAEGQPTTLAEALPAKVPNEQNANYHFAKAAWLLLEVKTLNVGTPSKNVASYLENLVVQHEGPIDKKSLSDDELIDMATKELDLACQCTRSGPVFNMSLGDTQVSFLLGPIFVNSRIGNAAKEAGDFHAVAESALQRLKLFRFLRNEPGMGPMKFSNNVNAGFQNLNLAMRSVDLSADFRKRMLTEFDQWETQRHLFRKINELRATYIQDKERSGKVRLQWAFLDQEELMNWFNYLLTFADEPIYKSREKFYKTPREGSRFHNDTATYLLWYREDYDAILAQSRCFRILNAIQIQAKQAGKQVGYIGELGLPDKVFQNPISGEELLVTQTSAGWKISIEGAKFLKNISVVHFKEACVPLEHVERPDK